MEVFRFVSLISPLLHQSFCCPKHWMRDVACFLNCRRVGVGLNIRRSKNQIAFCLQGQLKVKAGNGEFREIGPGGIWWMADTGGLGHTTNVIGDVPVKLAIVQLK